MDKIKSTSSADKQKELWQNYYAELESLIESIPFLSKNEIKEQDENIINFEVLKTYNSKKLCNTIDNVLRTNTKRINRLEYSFRLLFSKYPFIAWFSLLFALFLDITSLSCGVFVFILNQKNR